VAGCYEHGNESLGSIKGGKFLAEWLITSQEGLFSMIYVS
jgi:hypothetical protein